jgi:SAM-dependent methyltransferase
MPPELNPQAREMADESMVRNLAAQASAIWPQELPLLDRYRLPDGARLLDAGCGTGEIASRLALRFPAATVLGVDVEEAHLALARRRHAGLAPRLTFERRSVYELGLPAASFDLVVCRHVIQAIPHADRVLAELVRVLKPHGWLHLLAEDYGLIWFQPGALDAGDFWREASTGAAAGGGADAFVGRRAHGMLHALGLLDLRVDYVTVDTLRVPRETFAGIWTAWRDGYAEFLSRHTRFSREAVIAHFEDQLATLRDPGAYACWQVPIVSGRVP